MSVLGSTLLLLTGAVSAASVDEGRAQATDLTVTPIPNRAPAPAAEDKWVADKGDNICGISDAKKVSTPGEVDYDKLWDATPEIKKLKKDGIDPNSAEGKALRNQAKTRITKACQKVRKQKQLCSVWKEISHSGSKKPTDITDAVKKLF